MEFQLQRTIEILERTPKTLRALLEGLSEEWLENNEGRDTFSPRDVVGHLIHGEEADWTARLKIILEHGESKAFEPFDRFAFREKYKHMSLPDLLDRLGELRHRNLTYLKSLALDRDELDRKGTHPDLGPVTLRQLLATWAVHDLGHLGQIVRTMSKQYREAVGPWRKYLSILQWDGSA